ncbi:MAG: dihydroneopterin aldolase [Hyphomicrobiaceae bacterium]|nr:dihydroneopterin aldolase [Hyphomicrobiaceae bacterium]
MDLEKALATSDRIILNDLAFYGYHGVMLEENKIGCRFRVDVECGLDLSKAGRTDEVDDTISYELIFYAVEKAFNQKRFKLLEALAEHITGHLFEAFDKIGWIRIRIAKPEAPIPVVKGEFAVQIARSR